MSGLRPPVVAGVGGGVGTTTLAVALQGIDAGRAGTEVADILACRGTLASLLRAGDVLDRLDGPPPVLAVGLDGPRVPRGPLRTQLELLDAAAGEVVLLPLVAAWRAVADPLAEAARLLVDPPEQLPRPVRAYADALYELAAAVAATGRLDRRPGPPRSAPGAAPATAPARRPATLPDAAPRRGSGAAPSAARYGAPATPPSPTLHGALATPPVRAPAAAAPRGGAGPAPSPTPRGAPADPPVRAPATAASRGRSGTAPSPAPRGTPATAPDSSPAAPSHPAPRGAPAAAPAAAPDAPPITPAARACRAVVPVPAAGGRSSGPGRHRLSRDRGAGVPAASVATRPSSGHEPVPVPSPAPVPAADGPRRRGVRIVTAARIEQAG